MLQGTNFVNFVGFNAWVSRVRASARSMTEWEEPQAVIGSYLQRYAYPEYFERHMKNGRRLQNAQSHAAGRWVAFKCGRIPVCRARRRGMQVFDIAGVANKGLSQRIVTSPVAPGGQNTAFRPRCDVVALPTNQPINPARKPAP